MDMTSSSLIPDFDASTKSVARDLTSLISESDTEMTKSVAKDMTPFPLISDVETSAKSVAKARTSQSSKKSTSYLLHHCHGT